MQKVFISYSHDSDAHKERVLALSNRLRHEGIDCSLDRYESFPPEGWPRWMATQISSADSVLVVCTEPYLRRVQLQEEPGRGLGATWEGQLITQELYETGGRNTKFIPIVFGNVDVHNVPDFLRSATRFNVGEEAGYEDLYRLLTQQPAIVKPALGVVRSMPIEGTSPVRTSTLENLVDDSVTFIEPSGPIVVWRLPRGFIVFEDLETQSYSSWATVAHYFNYNGDCVHGTHYHASYRWLDRPDALRVQFIKLGIPIGDWYFATSAIRFMVDVREGHVTVSSDGTISNPLSLDIECATVHAPGRVGLPVSPAKYRSLAASGGMRDHVANAEDLISQVVRSVRKDSSMSPDFIDEVRRLRREVRIDVNRLLSETHPATKNLEEIIQEYESMSTPLIQWLRVLRDATLEAAQCIEEQAR